MKMFYVTLNNETEAKTISYELLEKQLAVCTNWFPIQCVYRWQGEIKQGSEVVLIIKTVDDMRSGIEATIARHIHYTNFIAELDVNSVNDGFSQWLGNECRPSANRG
jgi:periplasmic divalent cation tolerance protein